MRLKIQYITKEHITSEDDVRAFIWSMFHTLKLNFHPDTDFKDYIKYSNKRRVFTNEEVEELRNSLMECFKVCHKNKVDIYELCLIISDPITNL